MVCTDATEKMWKNVQILERRLGGSRPLVPPPVSRPRSAPCLLIVSDYRFNTAKVDTTPQKEHSLALNLTLMIAIFIMMSFETGRLPHSKVTERSLRMIDSKASLRMWTFFAPCLTVVVSVTVTVVLGKTDLLRLWTYTLVIRVTQGISKVESKTW